MKDNRTQHRRPVSFFVNKYVGGTPYLCRAVNLSEHGMLLHKLFEPAHEPGPVELEFMLPGTTTVIRLRGQVLAEGPAVRAHGVRFTLLSCEAQDLLAAFQSDETTSADAESVAL